MWRGLRTLAVLTPGAPSLRLPPVRDILIFPPPKQGLGLLYIQHCVVVTSVRMLTQPRPHLPQVATSRASVGYWLGKHVALGGSFIVTIES